MDYRRRFKMGILMLSSIIFLGSCEEGTVAIKKSSKDSKDSNQGSDKGSKKISFKDSNKGSISISKFFENLKGNQNQKSESKNSKPPTGTKELIGGGHVLAIGKVVGGSIKMWLSEEKTPRDWTELDIMKITNPHLKKLPKSLQKTFPSQLAEISFDGKKLKMTDKDGDIWSSIDNGKNWELEEFAGGIGTQRDPYQITNARHLWLVREEYLKKFHFFELIKEIDLSVVTEKEGFEPIGDSIHPFQGSFNGKNKIIRNLKIDRPGEDDVGLFGNVGKDGSILNIGLEDVDVKGGSNVGGLVGRYAGGRVDYSYVTGKVGGKSNVGGLIGANGGVIEKSYATANVTVTHTDEMSIGGGLVGYSHGGEIYKSYATGDVIGKSVLGGLVGHNIGNIELSYATGSVTSGWGGGNEYKIGGFVGYNEIGGTIKKSYATGNVIGKVQVGGFAGENGGVIKNSYAMGEVTGKNRIGGLVGHNDGGKIEKSYAGGKVKGRGTVSGDRRIGGFVGDNLDGGVISGYNYWKTTDSMAKKGVGKNNPPNGYTRTVKGLTDEGFKRLIPKDWDTRIWSFIPLNKYPVLKQIN